jgi:hypothetical protein
MRRPFVTGSTGGTVGTVMIPEILMRSSPGGGSSLAAVILPFAAVRAPPTLVYGSHASPRRSPSAFCCAGSAIVGQSSAASQTPSTSASGQGAVVVVVLLVVAVEVEAVEDVDEVEEDEEDDVLVEDEVLDVVVVVIGRHAPAPSHTPPVHGAPLLRAVQVAVQQDPAVPLAAP